MSRQTVLPLDAGGLSSLDSFAGSRNRPLVAELKLLVAGARQPRIMYVWGPPGSGKTHLLNASCIENRRSGRSSYYLSLEEGADSKAISCLTDHDSLVCIDNLECLDLDGGMQEVLFHTYEMLYAGQGLMLASGNRPLAEIGLTLRDLDSRLSNGGVFQIHPLSDEEKKDALRRRAKDKGFALDDAVINYILAHHSRQPRDLFGLLDRLGSESLRHQRKITIPFTKDLLRG